MPPGSTRQKMSTSSLLPAPQQQRSRCKRSHRRCTRILQQPGCWYHAVVELSAKEEGFSPRLRQAILGLIETSHIDPDAALLANERQRAAAVRAQQALAEAQTAQQTGFALDAVSVCVDDALDALYELTGERASDAVIDDVFSRFCVGK